MIFTLDERASEVYEKQKYIVIDNFLNHEKAARINEALIEIKPNDKWYVYDNLFEKKIATDNLNLLPQQVRQILYELNSQEFINYLEKLTGIDGLIPDPHYRGGGAHIIPDGGFLDLHTDRSFHPKLKLYRRVNALIYFNMNYLKGYGGELELWNEDLTKLKASIEPIYNRAVIFNTDATSWHGHPKPWKSLRPRMSIATYFFTATIPEDFKANLESTNFVARPGDAPDETKDKLREERRKLRL